MHVIIIVLYILKKESTINIVTWNTSLGSGGGSSKGFANVRNHIIEHFINNNPNYFYCIQEPASKEPFEKIYYSVQLTGKEAAIADDAKNITLRTKLPDIADCRYHGIQYVTDTQHRFLLISYHAPHRIKDKIKDMEKFFTGMLDVAKTYQMTVIIGGDFNYDVKEWKNKIEEIDEKRIKVADEYEVGELRKKKKKNVTDDKNDDIDKNVIDTFAVVYPSDGVMYTHCELMGKPRPVSLREAVNNYKEMVCAKKLSKEKKDLEDEIENLYMKMDHNPVAITVKLKTPKTDPK